MKGILVGMLLTLIPLIEYKKLKKQGGVMDWIVFSLFWVGGAVLVLLMVYGMPMNPMLYIMKKIF